MKSLRRSLRKNKGQSTLLQRQSEFEEQYIKRKIEGNFEYDEYDEYEEDGDARCLVCGTTKENYDPNTDSNGMMVQCTECKTWQHTKCMFEDEYASIPINYTCNICNPSEYEWLQCKLDPKGFTKGRRRSMEVDGILSSDGDHVKLLNIDSNGLESSRTRDDYLSDHEFDRPLGPKRSRKSVSFNKKQKVVSDSILKIRDAAVKMFGKLFLEYVLPETIQRGAFTIPDESTKEVISETLARNLEDEVYKAWFNLQTGELNKQYTEKVRILFSNLKDSKNFTLQADIINGNINFEKLVKMSVSELVNPSLREFREKLDQKALQDLILEREQKPLYMKTHKGYELIPQENESEHMDTIFNKGFIVTQEKDISIDRNIPNNKQGDSKYNSLSSFQGHNSHEERFYQTYTDLILSYPEISVQFTCDVKYIASSSKTTNTNVCDLIFKKGQLLIEGRVSIERSEVYLQQSKHVRDFILFEIRSKNDSDQGFLKLHTFLSTRSKHGAVRYSCENVKSIYIIPSLKNMAPPIIEQLITLENSIRSSQSLFVLIVVKKGSAS